MHGLSHAARGAGQLADRERTPVIVHICHWLLWSDPLPVARCHSSRADRMEHEPSCTGVRLCTLCKEVKPLTEQHWSMKKGTAKASRGQCKQCCRNYANAHNRKRRCPPPPPPRPRGTLPQHLPGLYGNAVRHAPWIAESQARRNYGR